MNPGPTRGHRFTDLGGAAALAAATLATGGLLQRFVVPTPTGLVVTAAAALAAFAAAGLLARRRLGNLLGGFGAAAVVLVALAAAAAVGTLVLQQKPTEAYREAYGHFAGPILAFGLDDVAHTFWFAALVGLLLSGLLISMIQRWPVRRRNLGFFLSHAGLLATIAGGGLSSLFAVKGRVELHVGAAPVDVAALEKDGLPTGQRVPLGFTVALDGFDVDRYTSEDRLAVYREKPATGAWALEASFDPEPGVRHRLPGGASFTIRGYYPDLLATDRVEPVAGGGGQPALQILIDGQEELLTPSRDRVDSTDGTIAVLLGRRQPPDLATTPRHLITLDGVTRPITPGGEVEFPGGVSVKAMRFFRRFAYDLEAHAAVDRPSGPDNPTLEVQIARGGLPVHRWLYANFQGHGRTDDGLPDVGYRFVPASTVDHAILVRPSSREVTVVDRQGRTVVPYADGLTLAGSRIQLTSLLPSARIVHALSSASAEPKNPAVSIDLEGVPGSEPERVLSVRAHSTVDLPGGAVLTFEKRGDEVRAYRSRVTTQLGSEVGHAVVAVNSPLSIGAWTLYQVNFDPKDPSYSGMLAVRDPGVPWVFLGFLLTGLGVLYTMTIEPRRRSAEEG